MAELTTLARPYAKAAFEFALAQSALSEWQKALSKSAAVVSHEKIRRLLSSPSLTAGEKGKTFGEVCGDVLDDKQRNFIDILVSHGRLTLLPQITALFELYKANQEKTIDVEIQSAFQLTPEFEKKFVQTLKQKLSRDVKLSSSVNKDLIGGALIRAGDMVIDGSARGRLAKLKDAMNV